MIPVRLPSCETVACSDLESSAADEGNLRGKEGADMVRMFKRLLRGGPKQRVTGAWVW